MIRKFQELKQARGSPDAYRFSKNMLPEVGRLFTYWHAFLLTGFSRQELWLATALIRGRMKRTCRHYQNSRSLPRTRSGDPAVRTRATRMLKNWDHLFTFLCHEGVEPTNHRAERAQGHAVQWRKICFGNQSEEGVAFTERILTVVTTYKLQGRNPFHFLTQVMESAFNGTPPTIADLVASLCTPVNDYNSPTQAWSVGLTRLTPSRMSRTPSLRSRGDDGCGQLLQR